MTKNKAKHETKRMLIILGLCLVFFGPLLAASLLYIYRNTYPMPLQHHGQLFTTRKKVESLGRKMTHPHITGKWQLLYFTQGTSLPKRLKNLHLALGKEQGKVILNTFVSHHPPAPFRIGGLAIVDPSGYLLMYYEPNTLQSIHAKGILEDMRKLLRCSHG